MTRLESNESPARRAPGVTGNRFCPRRSEGREGHKTQYMKLKTPMSDMIDAGKQRDEAMIQKCVDELGEHFDTVQIFATRHEKGENDGTVHVQLGAGNWFARYGHVTNWLVQENQSTRNALGKTDAG